MVRNAPFVLRVEVGNKLRFLLKEASSMYQRRQNFSIRSVILLGGLVCGRQQCRAGRTPPSYNPKPNQPQAEFARGHIVAPHMEETSIETRNCHPTQSRQVLHRFYFACAARGVYMVPLSKSSSNWLHGWR